MQFRPKHGRRMESIGLFTATGRRELGLVPGGWRAVTLARRREIRTLSKLKRKLLRSPFGFQNCTKTAKYEALEKNVVSNAKLPSRRQSLVRSFSYKGLSLLEILRPVDRVRW
jgi:hypothetical protein